MPRSIWLATGAVAAALLGPPLIGQAGASDAGAPIRTAAVLGLTLATVVGGLGLRSPLARRTPAPLVVGLVLIGVRLALSTPAPAPAETVMPGGSGPWTGRVVGVGSPRAGQQAATVLLDDAGLRVAATLPRYPEIAPGDRVSIGGRLEALPADDGGYGTYLRRIGVVATLRARTLDRLGTDGSASSAVEAARRGSGEALTRALPEPEAGLAAGILIGLRDRVDRDLAVAFTTAGVSHVVAISGWNIAIVAALVASLLRGRLGRRGRSLVTLGAIVAYTVAAGASASVVRAAVMAAVVLLARESGRAGAAATALGWAVTVLLLADPATVGDAGFQLSVLATGGLIAWATSITARLRSATRDRLPGWLTESLGVSFAAEAATLPIVLAGFGRFAVLAPAVNLVVVPLVPPAMATGTLALIGGWLVQAGAPAAVATLVGLPGWLVLSVLVAVVRLAAALPFASVTLAQPWSLVVGAAAAVGILALALGIPHARFRIRLQLEGRSRRGGGPTPAPGPSGADPPRPKRSTSTGRSARPVRALAVVVAVCVAAVVVVAANRPDGRVRVIVLDVGQGDAILVEGGRGGRLLVDGGPDPDRLLVALDARLPPWDRRIDLLVLTHPHEDHVAGLALLVARYRIGHTFEPGMIGPGPGYRAWQAALDRLGLRPGRLATGDRFDLDQVRFRVLWPDRDAVPREPADGGSAINNVSIVLLGEVGRQRFLLAGDIEEEIDPTLVSRGLPRVDLLKIAHHGSRTSSTGPFLDAVRPRVAIASAGAGNPYGHPTKATLDRVAARGAEVLRTDRNGSVEVTMDGATELDVRPDRTATARDVVRPVAASSAVPRSTVVARPPLAFACAIPVAGA
ncbi:MAG TPA: ComEC/Rec2 family competence protein [Patescibacteria group bacterium]|nr:ComEC/Rec2 family competence protein [Patescibacteria group bacterium]